MDIELEVCQLESSGASCRLFAVLPKSQISHAMVSHANVFRGVTCFLCQAHFGASPWVGLSAGEFQQKLLSVCACVLDCHRLPLVIPRLLQMKPACVEMPHVPRDEQIMKVRQVVCRKPGAEGWMSVTTPSS